MVRTCAVLSPCGGDCWQTTEPELDTEAESQSSLDGSFRTHGSHGVLCW